MWPMEANLPHFELDINISHKFHMVFLARKIHVKITLKQCLNFHMKFSGKFTLEYHFCCLFHGKTFTSICCCFWIAEWVSFFMFSRVVDQSKENRMQVHNVAIVFGPTLIWPETVTPNLAANMIYQSRIVEYCLLEFKNIFRWKKAHYPSIKRMVLFVRKREWEKQSTKMNEFGAWMMYSVKKVLDMMSLCICMLEEKKQMLIRNWLDVMFCVC